MSDSKDEFDPNDVLKGWSPRATPQGADADLTRALDGWRPGGATTPPPARRWADADVVDLPHVEAPPALDVADLGPIGRGAAAAARAGLAEVEDMAFTDTPVVVHRHVNPRLLAKWQPGAWTGAIQRVCDAVTEFVQTPQGPVIETYPPHLLLALWPPQTLDEPLLGRWPVRAMLSAAEADRASDELLPLMPPDALLWLTTVDVDWALVGELVLHHDADLRPFQFKALRSFVDAQREATFTRLNRGYALPPPGHAVTQLEHKS